MSQPKNAQQAGRGRVYRWGDEEFPSVTTILGALAKPALTGWAAKSVAEWAVANLTQVAAVSEKDEAAAVDLLKGAPWRERDAAADIGTLIHDIAEARVLGLPLPEYKPQHAGFVASFERFLDDWRPDYEATECEVYNRTHSYAGSADFIATLPGLGRVLGDYKTGKPARRTIYVETVLQLNAYAHGEFIGMPNGAEEALPPLDGCVALSLRPGGYKLVPVVKSDEVWRVFLYLRQLFHFQRHGDDFIGDPLEPPARDEAVEVAS